MSLPIAWYFKKNGLEHGPVESDDLRLLASMAMLLPTDPVRKEEMTRWVPAAALKGLFLAAAGATTPSGPARVLLQATASPSSAISHITPKPTAPGRLSGWIWYFSASAALVAIAAGIYRFVIQPQAPQSVAHHSQPVNWKPALRPVLTRDFLDPLLTAISSERPLDRGMAFRQVRSATVAPQVRQQVHQIICETLDNHAFSSIWCSAARALGEVGSRADLPRLKPLIERAPLETQCAAMATAMVLDPETGIKYFEPRAADERCCDTTTGYLADWGPRCEPVAIAMLKSPARSCRFHALFLLKAFGTSRALTALSSAKQAESDKLFADGYQFTMDAIRLRNQ